MALDFPASPATGTVFAPAGGPTYVYNGTAWLLTSVATAEARNRLVNPAFQISQEWGNTPSGPLGANTFYSADQWVTVTAHSPGMSTIQRVQSVTPNGSKDRTRLTVNTAKASLAASDYVEFFQAIEGIRVADFQWGTAAAKQVVIRFGWKSPAGTYCIHLANFDYDRGYLANFTIAAGQANTDTVQTFVVPGDTTGTWLKNNTGLGLYLEIYCAAGTGGTGTVGWAAGGNYHTAITNGMATNGNVFELFDCGLYLDPNATGMPPPWQMPDEAQELLACRRYYQPAADSYAIWVGYTATGSIYFTTYAANPTMRITPAVTAVGGSVLNFPAAVGTLGMSGNMTVRENRSASATADGSFFSSQYTFNARM